MGLVGLLSYCQKMVVPNIQTESTRHHGNLMVCVITTVNNSATEEQKDTIKINKYDYRYVLYYWQGRLNYVV